MKVPASTNIVLFTQQFEKYLSKKLFQNFNELVVTPSYPKQTTHCT